MDKPCRWCGMGKVHGKFRWNCGTRLTAKGSLVQSPACAEIASLKQRLREAVKGWEWNAKRLREAEELLREFNTCMSLEEMKKSLSRVYTFLSPTQPANPCIRCGKEEATQFLPEGICDKCCDEEGWEKTQPEPSASVNNEFVTVRREDLKEAFVRLDAAYGKDSTCHPWINGLRAALEDK